MIQDNRGVPASRLHVIQNWGERSNIVIDEAACRAWRRSKGIPEDAFVLGYAGNIGPAAGVEGLVEAFARVQDREDLYMLIAGSGARLDPPRRWPAGSVVPGRFLHTPWREKRRRRRRSWAPRTCCSCRPSEHSRWCRCRQKSSHASWHRVHHRQCLAAVGDGSDRARSVGWMGGRPGKPSGPGGRVSPRRRNGSR